MKYSVKLSDATHILAYLVIFANDTAISKTSTAIAQSIKANPSVVRKLMSDLKRAGLISNTKGAAKPKLAKPATQITLKDIYLALDGNHDLLHVDDNTNPNCPVGANIAATLDNAYAKVQAAALAELAKISLAAIVADLTQRIK